VLLAALVAIKSVHSVGASQVGLVTKRIGRKLDGEHLITLYGEAGYQADLLMPGLRLKFWPIYSVERFDWVQIPPDQVGLVIAQVGAPLPTGAKSAVYNPAFGSFASVRTFLEHGGQRWRAASGPASRDHRPDPPGRVRRHEQPVVRQAGE
jgi:uncharacterized membrane protein YqiK